MTDVSTFLATSKPTVIVTRILDHFGFAQFFRGESMVTGAPLRSKRQSPISCLTILQV